MCPSPSPSSVPIFILASTTCSFSSFRVQRQLRTSHRTFIQPEMELLIIFILLLYEIWFVIVLLDLCAKFNMVYHKVLLDILYNWLMLVLNNFYTTGTMNNTKLHVAFHRVQVRVLLYCNTTCFCWAKWPMMKVFNIIWGMIHNFTYDVTHMLSQDFVLWK